MKKDSKKEKSLVLVLAGFLGGLGVALLIGLGLYVKFIWEYWRNS